MLKSRQDIWSGVGFCGIALIFFVQYSDAEGVSRIFPEALISIIVAGGIYYLLKGFWELRREKGVKDDAPPENWGNIWWVTAMAILYASGIPFLGYWPCTFLFLMITYFGLVRKKINPAKALLIAALFGGGFSILVWLGFVKLMSVPTPSGLFF